jgi:hypothetical protein
VRRRRYRHISQIKPIDIEQLRNFQNKHHLIDLGQMERVTFIYDDGKISSYEKVPLHANTKSHIFNLDFSKYKNGKLLRHKSNASSLSSLDTDPKKGFRVERAQDLLRALDGLNLQERSRSEPPGINRNTEIRTRINELVGTVDSYDYLSMLTNRSPQSVCDPSEAYSSHSNSSVNSRSIPSDRKSDRKTKMANNSRVEDKVKVTALFFCLRISSSISNDCHII